MRWVLWVAALLLILGVSMSLVDRLLFFPERWMPDTPPAVEDRWFTTEDGVRIHAWLARAEGADAPTLLWAHGNGGNIGGRYEVQDALSRRGLNVLAYDYRGYGRSEGRPSEAGVYLDARAVYDGLVADGTPPASIVCLGESLGGAVTIALATERTCAGVAVVSTFSSIAEVARAHYGPLGHLATGVFDSRARIGEIAKPFFAAHGTRDEIVPFASGEALFQAAPEPKEFLRIEGAGHNDIFGYPEVLDGIARFSKRVVRESMLARDRPGD